MKLDLTNKEDEEVAKLVKWMKSNHISGSVISISKLWAIHEDVNHDYNFYRKMSHLLNIAELKGEIKSEWVASKRPIKEKVYQVLPKPVKKQPEHDIK